VPLPPLPIDAVLPELLARLREAGAVVLRAPTGAGKTTRVPPAILRAFPERPGRILMLEPRRVAARAAARRMAAEDGSDVGGPFGYHVRFDRKTSAHTRVVAVTPGILLRELHADPFLESVSCVVFDEFHERGLEADLALAMVRLVRRTVRPDLQVVVMSATLDAGPIAAYLGDAPVVTSEGRTFPVELRYRPRRADTPLSAAVASAVRDLLDSTDGDVLAFLPGLREIRLTAGLLDDLRNQGIEVLTLHGDLPPEQQDRALRNLESRKVVLSTNVAETSVTVEGVTAVVDGGLARQLEFEPGVGMDRLRLVPISRASADQRAGRAGRTQPGVCVRLWDEHGHRARPEHTEPEIRRVDLCGAVLQLLAFGEADVTNFGWFDPPRPEAVQHSLELLRLLGALGDTGLTPLGKELAGLPVHPRVGRMLIEGARLGVGDRAALAAALLSDRDPFLREDGPPQFHGHREPTESDVLDRVEALEAFEATGRTLFPLGELHRGGAKQVLTVRAQLMRSCEQMKAQGRPSLGLDRDAALLRSLFAAFPDRLARRRAPSDRRARMVGGRGVKLGPQSGVLEPELFVCVDVDAGGVESPVRMASGVRREWLPAEQLVTVTEVVFDEQTEKLIARKQTRFADLVLDDTPAHIADEDAAARVLADAAARNWEKVLPPPDSPAGSFLLRLRCLKVWMPDTDLPSFDDESLKAMLPDLCRGLRSLAAVRNGPWFDHLRGMLNYQQQQLVDREAPERMEVPSGSHIAIQYEPGRPPVLAARIQELFGLTETPRMAGGRVRVLLHLLAPNYRPQQVTDDLASFWANGYPLVRKELRARYPKHSWPDDPLTAEAIRGPKRRPG
jgi:ATP-dependent helicase HrpB